MYTLRLILVTLATLFMCIPHNRTADLRREIQASMDKNGAVGVSVAVVRGDSLCFVESFGVNPDYIHPEAADTIASDGIFRIASVSKTFVATAIMQLVENGLIDLDGDINNYLGYEVRNPRFSDSPITVRMLLGHRSSMTDYQYKKNRNSLSMFYEENPDLPSFFLESKPGKKYNYSNYGYNLLGAIVEKVSGKRFDVYVDEMILKPLGLEGSFNVESVDAGRLVRAYRYNKTRDRFEKSPEMFKSVTKELDGYVLGKSTALFAPCGGLKLSAKDLAKYMMMHMNGGSLNGVRVLSEESEKQMQTTFPGSKYGLGFHHASFGMKDKDFIGHQGGADGVYSSMFFNSEEKCGFVIICNGCKTGHDFDTEMLKILYRHFIS